METNKEQRNGSAKSQNFVDICMVGGGGGVGRGNCAPHDTNVCKMSRLCKAISSLISDISPSDSVTLLILRRSF